MANVVSDFAMRLKKVIATKSENLSKAMANGQAEPEYRASVGSYRALQSMLGTIDDTLKDYTNEEDEDV